MHQGLRLPYRAGGGDEGDGWEGRKEGRVKGGHEFLLGRRCVDKQEYFLHSTGGGEIKYVVPSCVQVHDLVTCLWSGNVSFLHLHVLYVVIRPA